MTAEFSNLFIHLQSTNCTDSSGLCDSHPAYSTLPITYLCIMHLDPTFISLRQYCLRIHLRYRLHSC